MEKKAEYVFIVFETKIHKLLDFFSIRMNIFSGKLKRQMLNLLDCEMS